MLYFVKKVSSFLCKARRVRVFYVIPRAALRVRASRNLIFAQRKFKKH